MMIERVRRRARFLPKTRPVRARIPSAVLLVVLAAGCGLRSDLPPKWGGSDGDVAVGLLANGSAFERSGMRRQVVRAIERHSGRHVVVLDGPASTDDPAVKELAEQLTKENPRLAGYDWHERRCAAHGDVLTAITRNVEAVYRVSLEYAERSRPTSETELAAPGSRPRWLAGFLGALHLASAQTVREERLTGSVTVTDFAPGGSRRATVSRTAATVEPGIFASRIDVDAAVGEAAAKLPAIRTPQWDMVARKLVSAGCPFLALEVYETRLQGVRKHRQIRIAALAAVSRGAGKRTPAQLAEETTARVSAAVREGDLDWAASIVEQYEADPARQPATVRSLKEVVSAARRRTAGAPADHADGMPGDETQSCNSLCSVHMVELCNNNKVLWTTNHAKWEPAPCGTRREEPFLTECYRQQWLAGTFDNACVRPCESTPDGRDRLIRLLRSSGCFRLKPA